MFTTLPPGLYKLVSTGGVAKGLPTSVTSARPAWQQLRLGESCDTWEITDRTYTLCGYPYVGLRGTMVIVSVDPGDRCKWISTEYNGAYIIRLASDPSMVWTVLSADLPYPCVIIAPLGPDGPTPDQLFAYEAAPE